MMTVIFAVKKDFLKYFLALKYFGKILIFFFIFNSTDLDFF